jgi:hypothetical protein
MDFYALLVALALLLIVLVLGFWKGDNPDE